MTSTWQPPKNYRDRPVAILGAGVLGRRLACIWASAGYTVHILDPSAQQRADCLTYVSENVASYAEKTGQKPGSVSTFANLPETVKKAWLVIEAVPEKIQLKINTFADLETAAPKDCILASNSSSYKSSEMISRVSPLTRTRVLNMHYYMPPQCMIVELMTDGYTAPEIFPFLVERSKEAGTTSYVARKESTGFIFNRLWAAVKREALTILAEGVSVPEEIDSMWEEMFVKGGVLPCRMMDNVGLDTVSFIESHYVKERGLPRDKTVDFLQREYIDKGRLGDKCRNGGLYPVKDISVNSKKIIVLDVGLAAATSGPKAGQILQLSADGKLQHVLVKYQAFPDGLSVDPISKRMFWTTMGNPGKDDGAVYSANLDGSDIKTIVPLGVTNTPKQLSLDHSSKKIYFSDREGLRVFRCNFNGSGLEILVQTGDHHILEERRDPTRWCVGVAVSSALGKFYWTQKGPSKGGKGRIFSADINMPNGRIAATRGDIQCLFQNLPEPIDLEIDEVSRTLYWTDRGELPFGNSLNRAKLDEAGLVVKDESALGYEVLTRHLNEAIGLKLDLENGYIYLTDLSGRVYRTDKDGKGKVELHAGENRAFTGVALV